MIRRIALVACVVIALPIAYAAPASAGKIPHACSLLTKKQASKLLLGKKVTDVERLQDKKIKATRCTWDTDFFQAPKFEDLDATLRLKLDVQPTKTAKKALDTLRSSAADIDSSVDEIDGIGDEAYEHFSDLTVVAGDVAFEVGVSNFDTSKGTDIDPDQIAQDAAKLIVDKLEG